ncbi:DNA-3-methyladenine glycosylase [Echinicola jeungdonensis]|uniref:Putative 3-methyladenine DNA glycosylase n=1 Tax=Echinicola jeungdonensis TaxID=709343 RepID=A0ABV5J5H3_9BACT|nr:DNA-3-methyladenine glycosylase [Echinicola jeungdonensis]MDN3670887.1 DNA-3-methyladenine glycosylase [Echinicola jeungdonensis]
MKDIKILPKEFFLNRNVVEISMDLLGKVLVTQMDGKMTMARIVETEAYDGAVDKACHAYPDKMTRRTEVMFKEGGRSYVYLCYGIHHLFNIVTEKEGMAKAVLVRAVEPLEGLETMKKRRNQNGLYQLTNGPGKVSQALGISTFNNDTVLYEKESPIWLGNIPQNSNFEMVSTTRVGVDYAGNDALLPWRFYIKNSPFISKK